MARLYSWKARRRAFGRHTAIDGFPRREPTSPSPSPPSIPSGHKMRHLQNLARLPFILPLFSLSLATATHFYLLCTHSLIISSLHILDLLDSQLTHFWLNQRNRMFFYKKIILMKRKQKNLIGSGSLFSNDES